ncbi:MAG: AsmA-like C-terminal region-containing protein [Bacteroidales bacterium]
MKKGLRVSLKIIFGVPLMMILLLVGAIGVFLALNATGKVNGVVKSFLNHYVEGRMEFDSLHFDFTQLPYITVNVSKGLFISALPGYEKDTLCYFSHLTCTIDPFKIASDNLIDIPYVYLTDPYAQVTLNAKGRPNWALWKFKKPKPRGDTLVVHKRPPIKLNIAKVRIYGFPKFHYENHHTGMRLDAHADSLLFTGRIAIDYKKLNASLVKIPNLHYRMEVPKSKLFISAIADSLLINRTQQQGVDYYKLKINTRRDTLYIKGKEILSNDAFKIKGGVSVGADYKLLGCSNLRFEMGTTVFMLNGNMQKEWGRHAMNTDMLIWIYTPNLAQTIHELPLPAISLLQKLKFNFPMFLAATAQGTLWPSESLLPTLKLKLSIPRGSVEYASYPSLKELNLLAEATIDPNKSKRSEIIVNRLTFRALHSTIAVFGRLNKLPDDPLVSLQMKNRIDLQDLNALIKGDFLPRMSGRALLDMEASFPLAMLKRKDLRQLRGNLQLNIADLYAKSQKEGLDIAMEKLIVNIPRLGAPSNNGIELDTMLLEVLGSQANIHLRKNADFCVDRFKVDAALMLVGNPITKRLKGVGVELLATNADFQTDSTTLSISETGLVVHAERAMLDAPFNGKDDKMSLYSILQQWDFQGAMALGKTHVLTPYLPLDNVVNGLELSFSSDCLNLRELLVNSGESDLKIKGTVTNWEKYLRQGDKLSADFIIKSDSLKLSELIPAIAAGVLSQTRGKSEGVDSLASRIFPPNFIPPTDRSKRGKEKLIVIPDNLNVKIALDAKQVDYEQILLDSAEGSIVIADQSLLIDKMKFTSGMGNIDLSASYKTPSLYEASTDLTLKLSDLDVNSVLRMIPDLPSLVPMLTTLEGELGCNITAEAKLDSAMYVEIPSLYSVAQVRGEHLSIEKDKVLPKFLGWLIFGKNKKIELDSVRVDLIVKDSILSVYPFVVDVGRYRLLARGVQHLDQSFFYHLTLLKWPLWVKLGFDVYGKPHQVHFKLACPKLTNLALPAKVLSVKETKLYPAINVQNTLKMNELKQKENYQKLFLNYRNNHEKEQDNITPGREKQLMNRLDELLRQEQAP